MLAGSPRNLERPLLYRLVFVSEMVGEAGIDVQSVAEILGESHINNRRDEISSAMMFHAGEAAQLAEGARGDLDRLLTRVANDPRHRNVQIREDRPVMQRRICDTARLCGLTADQERDIMRGRRLSDLSSAGLEKLLSCEHVKLAA